MAESYAIKRAQANELWYELFAKKGKGWLSVLTGSMAPLIRPGDEVLIESVPASQVGNGDIILFRRNGELIVHRVLRKLKKAHGVYFLEQGDARHLMEAVSADMVLGRVAKVKSGSKVFDLAPPLSRVTSKALTTWLYLTSSAVSLFKRSENRNVKKSGRVLSDLVLLLSGLLIRACFVVWYPAGMLTIRNGERVQRAVAKERTH